MSLKHPMWLPPFLHSPSPHSLQRQHGALASERAGDGKKVISGGGRGRRASVVAGGGFQGAGVLVLEDSANLRVSRMREEVERTLESRGLVTVA